MTMNRLTSQPQREQDVRGGVRRGAVMWQDGIEARTEPVDHL